MAYGWAYIPIILSLPVLLFGEPESAWPIVFALPLAILGYSIQEGSRLGAVLQLFLFLGLHAYLRHRYRWPVNLGDWVNLLPAVFAAGLVLSGMIATFTWARLRRNLGALPRTSVRDGLRHHLSFVHSKRIWQAVGYVFITCVCFSAALAAPFVLDSVSLERELGWIEALSRLALLILVIVLAATGMAYSWRMAKRYATLRADEMRRRDTRLPVLLLRSFRDDLTTIERRPTMNVSVSFYDRKVLTLEEVVEEALWRAGPAIAIGRPGELLPPAGAAREYVSADEWQTRVKDLIAECRYIAVIAGRGEGLAWECQMLREAQALAKVIVIFPPASTQRLENLWGPISAALSAGNAPLPAQVLTAQLGTGAPRFVTCRWNDEDGYRLAIEQCLLPKSSVGVARSSA